MKVSMCVYIYMILYVYIMYPTPTYIEGPIQG